MVTESDLDERTPACRDATVTMDKIVRDSLSFFHKRFSPLFSTMKPSENAVIVVSFYQVKHN